MKNQQDIDYPNNRPEAPGQDNDNQDRFEEIQDNLKSSRISMASWRTEARSCYDFFSGKQWDEVDSKILQEQNRPAVVFNRTGRTINAVCGLEINNRQEARFLPREIGSTDAGFSDFMTQVAKWIRESCDAEDEESEMFWDNVITGMGWTETRIDYQEGNNGKIYIDRVDPLEMAFDPESRKRNCLDARWVARIKQLSKREFKERWPNKEFTTANYWQSDVDGDQPHDATDAWLYKNDQTDKLNRDNSTWVAQYQYYEQETYFKVLTPEGRIVEFPESKFRLIEGQLSQLGIRSIKFLKKVYKECFVNGKEILEEKDLGCNHFTFQATTGFRNRNENSWFGLVSPMKDPQRWANKWLSQIQYILNSSAKSGLIVESGVLKDKRKAEETWAKPGAITELNPGGMGKLQQVDAPRYPEGLDRLLQYALQSINDVPGVSLEMIGMADRNQPIGLEESRKQSSVTILATLFNSLRLYRKNQARVLAYFIRAYMPEGELVRIVGEDGQKYVPLVKDKLAFDYDIVVDDAPTSPNMKERLYPVINQTMQMSLAAGIPVPPEVLDYMPLPDNLVQKWKRGISNNQDPLEEQMKQIAMMQAQLELEQKQASIQKTNSEVTFNYAKAEQAHATGQDESAQAMQKMGLASAANELRREQMIKEQDRKYLEMLLNERRKNIEMQLKHNNINRGY